MSARRNSGLRNMSLNTENEFECAPLSGFVGPGRVERLPHKCALMQGMEASTTRRRYLP